MSTAHLALNYRPQGVTGDPLRVARPGLKSLNYLASVGVLHGVGCEIRHRSSTTFRDPPPECSPLVSTHTPNAARTADKQIHPQILMSLLVYLHAGVPEPANKCPHTARVPEYMYGMQAIPQAYPYSAHCRL